jgi:hypothetical protein
LGPRLRGDDRYLKTSPHSQNPWVPALRFAAAGMTI